MTGYKVILRIRSIFVIKASCSSETFFVLYETFVGVKNLLFFIRKYMNYQTKPSPRPIDYSAALIRPSTYSLFI